LKLIEEETAKRVEEAIRRRVEDHPAMCEEMKEKLSQHHRQSEHAGVRPFAASDSQRYVKLIIEEGGVDPLLKLLTKSTSLNLISSSLSAT